MGFAKTVRTMARTKSKSRQSDAQRLADMELAIALMIREKEQEQSGGGIRTDLTLPEYVREAWHVIEPATPFIEGWHIDLISEYLTAVSDGEIKRLLINIPPRHCKSILVSVMWPTWEWTKKPHTRWIFASYSGSLSTKHSMDRRTILSSEWYEKRWKNLFTLQGDQNQKMEFVNSQRGAMVATSIGGTATGKGGNRVVIDDPHNPKQAESDLQREEAVTFFDRTLSNRLDDKRNDAIVCVMQRLHEQDMSARMIELGFTHLKIPAVAEERTVVHFPKSDSELVREEGDLIWPEKEGEPEIKATRESMGAYAWAGQYQQGPVPSGGGMFRKEWFKIVDAAPSGCRWVRYWDKAGSVTKSSAYTVGCLMGMSPDRRFYVADIQRDRLSAGAREALILQTATIDGRGVQIWTEQEPGSGGMESAENTTRMLAGYNVHSERSTGDKESRARPYAAQVEAGNVYLVNSPWVSTYLAELSVFPNSTYKDQADASSGAFLKLALLPIAGRVLAGGTRAMTATILSNQGSALPLAALPGISSGRFAPFPELRDPNRIY